MACCNFLSNYSTTRIVLIKDRRLGLMYYSFLFAIFSYTIIYNIFYMNSQFENVDVNGGSRITIQHPTKKSCNPNKPTCESDFTPLDKLSYCSVYKGASDVDEKHQHECIFADHHTLAPDGMLGGTIMIPTRLDSRSETRDCQPGPDNHYSCKNEFNVDEASKMTYVADVDRFTLLISHSYGRNSLFGNNRLLKGWYDQCNEGTDAEDKDARVARLQLRGLSVNRGCRGKWEKKPIECVNEKCDFLPLIMAKANAEKDASNASPASFSQQSQKEADVAVAHRFRRNMRSLGSTVVSADSEEDSSYEHWMDGPASTGAFSIKQGDIFTVSKLLDLAGVSLDHTFNNDNESLREAGTAINIEVTYENLRPWFSSFGYSDVRYSYKVTTSAMDEMKTEVLARIQPQPDKRTMESRHGLYVTVRVGGTFGFFSLIKMLMVLTTGAGLLGGAVFVTNQVAMRILPDADELTKMLIEEVVSTTERRATSEEGAVTA